MDVDAWNQRYRSRQRQTEELEVAPTPLLVETGRKLRPGKALDLGCGAGRNTLWLARNGWSVTAVDGAPAAIAILGDRARNEGFAVDAQVADLKSGEFQIATRHFDLITICYYLQRDLFVPAKSGVKPGGVLLAIAHTTEGNEEPTENRLRPGELEQYFYGWEILHYYEGKPADPAHRRSVSEIVAKRRVISEEL